MPSTPHILIVDDHRELRELVSRALAKEGFICLTVHACEP
jgi:two-component system OmpR family response regulator